MEHLFQSDVNGVLEQIALNGDDLLSPVDLLIEALSGSLKYYQHSPDSRHACHTVLYRACFHAQDAGTSFDVSRYERGIQSTEYFDCVQRLGLSTNLQITLNQLPDKDAILVLQTLLSKADPEQAQVYYPVYLQRCHTLPDPAFSNSMTNLCSLIQQDATTMPTIQACLTYLVNLYESRLAQEHQWPSHKQFLLALQYHPLLNSSQLIDTLHHVQHLIDPPKQTPRSPPAECFTAHSHDSFAPGELQKVPLKIRWRKIMAQELSPLHQHQMAFQLLIQEITHQAVPTMADAQELVQLGIVAPDVLATLTAACLDLQACVSEVIAEAGNDPHLDTLHCLMTCLEWVQNVRGSWRSIVKAMVQFVDLWQPFLTVASVRKSFTDLVVVCGLWKELFAAVGSACTAYAKLTPQQQPTVTPDNTLRQCLKDVLHLLTVDQLFVLRDMLYLEGTSTREMSVLNLWSEEDEMDLTKCCNQLTSNSEDGTAMTVDTDVLMMDMQPDDVADPKDVLARLTVIWPVHVVDRLLLQCLTNDGQQLPVVLLLQQLGSLCMLRAKHGEPSLLLDAMGQSSILEMTPPSVLSKFITYAYYGAALDIPLFVDPLYGTAERKSLFDPIHWVQHVVLPQLGRSENMLELLYRLICQKNDHWHSGPGDDIPPLLLLMGTASLLEALAVFIDDSLVQCALSDASPAERLSMIHQKYWAMTLVQFFISAVPVAAIPSIFSLNLTTLKLKGYRYQLYLQGLLHTMDMEDQQQLQTRLLHHLLPTVQHQDLDPTAAIDALLYYGPLSPVFMHNFKTEFYRLQTDTPQLLLWTDPKELCVRLYQAINPLENFVTDLEIQRIISRVLPTLVEFTDQPALFTRLSDPAVGHLTALLDHGGFGRDGKKNATGSASQINSARYSHAHSFTSLDRTIYVLCKLTLMLLSTSELPEAMDGDNDTNALDAYLGQTSSKDRQVNGTIESYLMAALTKALQKLLDLPKKPEPALNHPKKATAIAMDPELTAENDASACKSEQDIQSSGLLCLYYPFYNKRWRSKRALCLLVFDSLCTLASAGHLDEATWKVWRLIVMHLVQFLADHAQRTLVDTMYPQPKGSYQRWNKDSTKIRIHMRPVLDPLTERPTAMAALAKLPFQDDKNAIAKTLLHQKNDARVLLIRSSTPPRN
ncbi:hypothetical protein DM01DRAFT_1407207 [Hesseltinella vesiculosa]|uniref:Uncharacterized protein n=1 Tax=Hesseltinella vesiculosa TaxID=101127 RepID=A0A1X2GJS4_9FUNG|nr:hypothetical protein DM01DRAFT_1407207 [Hesseltinella vesiculosa]